MLTTGAAPTCRSIAATMRPSASLTLPSWKLSVFAPGLRNDVALKVLNKDLAFLQPAFYDPDLIGGFEAEQEITSRSEGID